MTSEYTVEELKLMLLEAEAEEKERVADRRYRHIQRRKKQLDDAIEAYGKPEIADKRVTVTDFNNKYHPPRNIFPEFYQERLEGMGFVKANKFGYFMRFLIPHAILMALVFYLALLDV